ncbi:ABC transporter ATP-binding protein [Fischerella sp. PCC 9605]|uniref:ABC transporter ATP-binding protein n=1 Tax=Fischerella sp. PCC 9605 TaxID=1173024 RepID=UPI00047CEB0C|nr:energy-coupling factor transporter ATPase [Fischerella sp. PCC 9605]
MSIVNAKNFTFIYPGADETIIDGISFEMKQGEIIGIIGPLGAGKTTLCMAIAGFAPRITGGDSSGELEVVNHNPLDTSSEEHDRQVGMVFEDYEAQLVQIKVLDEVTTPLIVNRGLSQQEAEERARELVEKVGLGTGQNIEKKRIWELSGGQQQRLAIAATLAIDPQLLILDNVIDKLDPRGQEQVRVIVNELCRKKTLVVVEQDINFLAQCADRLLVLANGNIIAEGTPEEIFRDKDLLSQADVELPVSVRVAHALGLSESPLTPEEFKQLVNFDSQVTSSIGNGITRQSGEDFGESVVCIEDVTYCYSGDNKAIANMNIQIRAGEIHAIVGHNGAGKTTVAKHIAGLLKPTKGKVTVCNTDTRDKSVPELALMVGTVLQNPDEHISERTVKDEIAFPLKQRQHKNNGLFSRQKRYDDNYIEEKVSQICELVGIEENLLDSDPTLLPRGQRKLVTIAAALVVDPKVLILDEPTVGLGASSRQKIAKLLSRLTQKGKAVLLVSNNVDFVCETADTVTVLNQGRVVLQGSVRNVFAQDNWDRLQELHVHLPRVAQLAQHLGVDALTCEELVSKLCCS